MVFLEETEGANDPDGHNVYAWNDNTWDINIEGERWYDPLGALHNGSNTFGFADGHAEKHKWRQDWTIEIFELGEKDKASSGSGEKNVDFQWFLGSYIPGRK